MKPSPSMLGVAAGACAVGLAFTPRAAAAVSDEDFTALKRAVQQLNDQVQTLMQTHQQDVQTHQQDQRAIDQLRQQLGETQQLATNAVQKAEAAAQVQPIHPIPPATSATHNFSLAGDAETIFGRIQGQKSAFAMADFAPIFLYRANDNVLFEAGFDFTLANSAPANPGTTYNFDLSFATLDYLFNDYVTVVAGNMLLPLGTYSERSAGWLNKIPDNPLPRGLLPNNGIGAQLRGGIPVGTSGAVLSYSAYGVNGPSSVDGTGNSGSLDLSGNVGVLASTTTKPPPYGQSLYSATTTFGGLGNLHSDPSGGGRVGFFYPFKAHYDLELGVSGQTGQWDDFGDRWSALVLDAAVHLSPSIELKGEYINTWQDTSDLGTIRPHGWWIQGGYKLAGLNLDLPLINNFEIVGRYDTTKDGLSPSTSIDRYTAGLVYYLTNTLLLEGDYEWLHSNGPSSFQVPSNEMLFQISYGF